MRDDRVAHAIGQFLDEALALRAGRQIGIHAQKARCREDAAIKQLWPDQETYRREEQRRFEILLAHWDLPVTDITPKKP